MGTKSVKLLCVSAAKLDKMIDSQCGSLGADGFFFGWFVI